MRLYVWAHYLKNNFRNFFWVELFFIENFWGGEILARHHRSLEKFSIRFLKDTILLLYQSFGWFEFKGFFSQLSET